MSIQLGLEFLLAGDAAHDLQQLPPQLRPQGFYHSLQFGGRLTPACPVGEGGLDPLHTTTTQQRQVLGERATGAILLLDRSQTDQHFLRLIAQQLRVTCQVGLRIGPSRRLNPLDQEIGQFPFTGGSNRPLQSFQSLSQVGPLAELCLQFGLAAHRPQFGQDLLQLGGHGLGHLRLAHLPRVFDALPDKGQALVAEQ